MDHKKTALRETEKNSLQRHWTTLKKDVRMVDIVDTLIEEGVLKPAEWEDMKREHRAEKDQMEGFLHILLRKTSNGYEIFLKALRKNGYEHIASKLYVDMKQKQTQEEDALNDNRNIMKMIQDLTNSDKMKQRELAELQVKEEKKQKELTAFMRDQEVKSMKLEQKSMKLEQTLTLSLRQTNVDVQKLKETLHIKETEIEKLKTKQAEQESLNRNLQEENKKLQIEGKRTQAELKIASSETEQLKLKIDREKTEAKQAKENLETKLERQNTILQEEREQRISTEIEGKRTQAELKIATSETEQLKLKIDREKTEAKQAKEILETKLERQNTILQEEREQRIATEASLEREKSDLETYRRDNEELVNKVHKLESDIETVSRRPPSGLSQMNDNNSEHMTRLKEETRELENSIKEKQTEQKYLERRLRQLKPDVSNSSTCVVQ